MRRTSRFAFVALLVFAGCSAEADLENECAPLVTESGAYECPAGCTALSGQIVDEERGCVRRASTVVACHPPDATLTRTGDLVCLDREGAPSPVMSASTALWMREDGTSIELYSDAGWAPCEDVELPLLACETD